MSSILSKTFEDSVLNDWVIISTINSGKISTEKYCHKKIPPRCQVHHHQFISTILIFLKAHNIEEQ